VGKLAFGAVRVSPAFSLLITVFIYKHLHALHRVALQGL
jgi:hypothetical protein